MDFVSWLVVGALLMLTEFGVGSFYLFAAGLACTYASYAAFIGSSTGTQLSAFTLGSIVHIAIVKLLRRSSPPKEAPKRSDDIGKQVQVIEWLDSDSARVMYEGKEWLAEKIQGDMPDAEYGTIEAVQYGRLLISTRSPDAASAGD